MRKTWWVVASASFSLAAARAAVIRAVSGAQAARSVRAMSATQAMRAIWAVTALGLPIWLSATPPAFAQKSFTVTSKDFVPGKQVGNAQIYDNGGCSGKNESPQLQWTGAPAGTKSFAVTMFDPDAPGPGWWHWAVVSIPANVGKLPSNASASGFLKHIHAVEARNDFEKVGYGGPCPPPGHSHRYVVTVYALGTADLGLADGERAPMFDHAIGTTILGNASITVTYGR